MNEARPDATERVTVGLGTRSYDIVVGADLIAGTGPLLAPLFHRPRAFVVSDANVAPLYLASLATALAKVGIACTSVVLPAGEATKDLTHLDELTDRLLAERIERSDILVALGGGVVGDIAGFAAAILLRGLDIVQVPTTLLAQVDSSVGGKTGINTRHGKNLLGAFHQPRLVLADVGTLETLPRRELASGYAEVVKYGLLGDADFFAWLEANGERVCAGDRDARRRAVIRCCAAKAAIVAEDERESGRRALLNLGHTFGHALEAACGFGDRLLHGEAVAIGMVLAFDLSVRLGLCPPSAADRVRRHLAARGLPVAPERLANDSWTADALIDHMMQDKKVSGGRLTLVLVRDIGQAFISREVAANEVRALLASVLAA